MTCDLILDGNYILNKNTFTLHKNNLLFGGLHRSLEYTINNYRKWFNFSNVYLVSDSKEKSWRKSIIDDYKGTRKKDSNIDWKFVYNAYDEYKESLTNTKIKVFEYNTIEGDDWISYLTNKSNKEGRSTVIVSNDYDIKQLVSYNLDPLCMNIMTNEMQSRQKLFLPKNYSIFLNELNNQPNDDIFNLNDNVDYLKMLDNFMNKYDINEVDPIESLMIKVISGDASDNIKSIWSQVKNGKRRGIGEKGAISIYNDYLLEFGEMRLDDPDLYENIADLICEKKKLAKSEAEVIISNIENNIQLIDLRISNLPDQIVNKMEKCYDGSGKGFIL